MDSTGHMVYKPCTPNLSPLRGSLTIVFLSKSFDHKPVDCENRQKRLLNRFTHLSRKELEHLTSGNNTPKHMMDINYNHRTSKQRRGNITPFNAFPFHPNMYNIMAVMYAGLPELGLLGTKARLNPLLNRDE